MALVCLVSFKSKTTVLAFLLETEVGGQRGWSSLSHVDAQLPNNTLLKYNLYHKKSPLFMYTPLKQKIISERITLIEQHSSTRLCSPAPPSTFPASCQLGSGWWTCIMLWKEQILWLFTGTGYFGLSQCLNLGPNIFEWLFEELFDSNYSAALTILSPSPFSYPIERKP